MAQLKAGDQVKFYLGETPMRGTLLFAVGTGAAVRLPSGTEIIVAQDLLTKAGK